MQGKRKDSWCNISLAEAPNARHRETSSCTPEDLRNCNDLTRLSPEPGFLDYETYVRYLMITGHLKVAHVSGVTLPLEPQNSALETPEEAHEYKRGDRNIFNDVLSHGRQDSVTSWRADQALWHEQNLPEILYAFDRPRLWLAAKDLREPPLKRCSGNGVPLRDIPILPDHISPDLEGWRHVAWTRMDPRISSRDILDRMGDQPRANTKGRKRSQGQTSTIQMRTARFREDFPALGWVNKGSNFESDRDKLKGKLAAVGVLLSNNTTRGVSWGLVDIAKGESGGRIPVPETKSWPNSVGQQPAVLPVLSTLLLGGVTELSDRMPCHQTLFFKIDTLFPRDPLTPKHHHGMSFSSSFGDASTLNASFSSVDNVTESPRKRQKITKLQRAKKYRGTIDELPFESTQRLLQFSEKDPYQAAYNRSLELQKCFDTHPDKKQNKRDIPDDVLTSSLPEDADINPISTRVISQETLPGKLHRLQAAFAAKNVAAQNASKDQLPVTELAARGIDEVITIEHGRTTLILKSSAQRLNLGTEDSRLLTTFHPAGSEERNRQLEYILDPILAPYGFQDCNGYEAPVMGDCAPVELRRNIWYKLTGEEALWGVKTTLVEQAFEVPDEPQMLTPGAVMYKNGQMKLFADLRKVPVHEGEVGRARRFVQYAQRFQVPR